MVLLFASGIATFTRARMSSDSHLDSQEVTQSQRPNDHEKVKRQRTVILMRHGMTDWNQEGRVQGGLDKSRLNNTGAKQARLAGLELRKLSIEKVLCSPLRRAADTLQLLAESSANPDLRANEAEFIPELMEFQVPWQGHLKSELVTGPLKKEYMDFKKNPLRFSFNGFNPIRDLYWRAEHVWEAIGQGQSSSYLVISHNQMNKALISSALGMPINLSMWNQDNCSFNVFLMEDGKPASLRLCNGIDLSGQKPRSPRAPRKRNFLRFVMHLQGRKDGLLQETSEQKISHTCCVKTHPTADCDTALCDRSECHSTVTVPSTLVDTDMYTNCADILENIRRQHGDGYAVVSVSNARVHSAMVSACLGLGHEGIQRFHSDPGGVTVIDVKATAAVGSGKASVEYHNNYAYNRDHGGFLVGYTNTTPETCEQNGLHYGRQ